ncbi:ATPase family AAA domain-containing protein 2-like [Papaver somniferum]|uniref:ATPase family AAA domain-containing protein 2-like n=1 Tax=Papaver somniferum TaxID=3469 RepID=UPI000E6FF303|nr:ATPase family AAA domain-containing protein 2-like [Papaver somniferum]
MTRSLKIEGEFSGPNQAATAVSTAESNIEILKSEMLDYSLLSDPKIPKTEDVANPALPENIRERKPDIKTPRSKRGNDSLTPLKRKFRESSCHPIEEEHGATNDDGENSSTGDDKDHDSTDNSEDHGSSDEDEGEEHSSSTDEDEGEEHSSSTDEDGSTDEDDDEDEELVMTYMLLLMMAFVLTTMHFFQFRP